MADIQVGAAIHINGQMETNQEKAEIQEVAIQIDDPLKTTTTIETSQDLAVPIDKLKIYLKKMVSELPGEPLCQRDATIFRLPSSIHENKKELCEPNLVAIGPYHHGKESLRTMEEHKCYLFRDFLARNEDVDLEDYLQAMRSIEAKARICYSENVDMGSDDFVKMLLLDGCFILEWAILEKTKLSDALCDLGWASYYILPDMCLLENQVPFFVLHDLWTIRNYGATGHPNCKNNNCPLLELFCPVLKNCIDFTPFRRPQVSCDDIFHLLHLCYLGVVPDSKPVPDSEPVSDSKSVPNPEPVLDSQPQTQCEKNKSSADILRKVCRPGCFLWSKLCCKSDKPESSEQNDFVPNLEWTIPSISELHDAGVRFKRKKNFTSMFDISFGDGTIEMPFLQIQNDRITILWNMIAFEQSRIPQNLPQTLSSYLALMDTLINTDKDIAILEKSGIFENIFENAEEAATFFNQFDKYFVCFNEDHYFKGLFQDVRKYTQSRWPRYRARLMQDYFRNPWTIISVVAAGILLILTVVQTYYSVAK